MVSAIAVCPIPSQRCKQATNNRCVTSDKHRVTDKHALRRAKHHSLPERIIISGRHYDTLRQQMVFVTLHSMLHVLLYNISASNGIQNKAPRLQRGVRGAEGTAMYLDQVMLKNIRGFEQLNFTLTRPDGSHAGWTVFTGDNGSGKSSLLRAIAMGLLGPDVVRALLPDFNRWVRDGAQNNQGSIQLTLSPVAADDTPDHSHDGASSITARLTLKRGERETTLRTATPTRKTTGSLTPEQSIWSPDAAGWFSCGYGPFRRVFGAASAVRQLMSAPRTARFITMFNEAASLAETDAWLRELKFRALEQRKAEGEQLELLITLLNDDLLPNQMRVDRVDADGLWLVDRNGIELSWNEMSDGYRVLLALLADLIHHLLNAYISDGLAVHTVNGHLTLNRSGVVLIDEVDAHLHPEWQREIGFWLKRRFPKLQFLVTTHSPIICQAADPNGLFVLPEPGSSARPHALSEADYTRVITSRPDTILLTPAFGLQNTRSPAAVEARRTYAHLASKQDAGGTLSSAEQHQFQQLERFALNDEQQTTNDD